jgi:hypothetical protein
MRGLVVWLSLATAFAAVDGTVQNRTTGKPQPGAMVLLFKLGQAGPEMLASAKSDAEGRFSFVQAVEGGPHLLEAAYAGVTYNLMLPPGTPATNLQIDVFDSSKQPGRARLTQHMVLLEPTGQQLNVSETFFFNNDGNLTYHDPANGTLRFFVPAAAKDSLKVMGQVPQGMPVERAAEPAGQPDVYKLNFAIKPGETRIDVAYAMPFTSPGSFAGRLFARGVPTRLVVPNGVTLSGEGLKALRQEPSTQAGIYEVSEAAYQVNVVGTGSLRAANEDAGDEGGPAIEQILPPRVYDRLAAILIPALVVLALGFTLLYRRGEQRG